MDKYVYINIYTNMLENYKWSNVYKDNKMSHENYKE